MNASQRTGGRGNKDSNPHQTHQVLGTNGTRSRSSRVPHSLLRSIRFQCRASRIQQRQLGCATTGANLAGAGRLWNVLLESEPRGQCKGQIGDPCFNFAPLTTSFSLVIFSVSYPTAPCWIGVGDNGCWILHNA